jgi:NADPH:quinone reductase
MRAVVFTGAGGNEVVQLVERPEPVPGPEELLLRVDFAGLNPADLMQRDGRYPAPPGVPADIPGLEVAGTVVAHGERVYGLSVGDRVFGIVAGGGLAERVLLHERCAVRIPDALDDRAAAAVPEAFVAAHDALRGQARLCPGETVVIHGASGGVGTAAIQIGVLAGARVIAVVRSAEAATAVEQLGAEAVLDADFRDEVLRLTGGAGADVILELVGAPHFPANLEALAVQGRIVVVGVGAGTDIQTNLLLLMQRRATIRGTVLRGRPLEEKAVATRRFAREIVPALASGRVRPIIDSVFPAGDIVAALEHLASPGKRGKVLISFSPSAP